LLDLEKQIAHWRAGAREDWDAAADLVEQDRMRHGLFFAHLAIKKLLKAHVCSRTGALAPRIHSLLRLAVRAGMELTAEQKVFLGRFDRFQIQGDIRSERGS